MLPKRLVRASTKSNPRRALKATMILVPIFGVNNLLFCYNPGGTYQPVYMITSAIFQGSQGFVVTLLYYFSNKDVHQAIRREYCRYKSRRYHAKRSSIVTLNDGKLAMQHLGEQV